MQPDHLTVLKDLVTYHEKTAGHWRASGSKRLADQHDEQAAAIAWALSQIAPPRSTAA